MDESELAKFIQEITGSRMQNFAEILPNEMKREGLEPVFLTSSCKTFIIHSANKCYCVHLASYLSMLIQTLFQVKEFVAKVIEYKEPKDFGQMLASLSLKPETEERKKVLVYMVCCAVN